MANHEEHLETAAVVAWASYFPELKNLMGIPNGAHLAGTTKQRAAKMARLKKEGFRKGASDLFLPVAKKGFHGMWIEMKRARGGAVSADQKDFINDMTEAGYYAVVCRGAEEAIKAITNYMNLRGKGDEI